MWVRSQDKKTLVKVDKLIIAYDTDEKIYEIHNVYDSLGVYKSKERALEVLDEIQEFIMMSKTTQLTTIYEMPKEWLNEKEKIQSNQKQ